MKRFFKYLEPLWMGNDKKISLRSLAAIALIIDFIINVHNSVVKVINLSYKDKTIDPGIVSALSGNLAQIAMILGIEAALIAAMLALKTYQKHNLITPQINPQNHTEEGS